MEWKLMQIAGDAKLNMIYIPKKLIIYIYII